MFSTVTGNTTGQNFAAFSNITAQLSNVLIIDFFNFINTEAAYFSSRSSASFAFHSLKPSLLKWDFLVKRHLGAKRLHVALAAVAGIAAGVSAGVVILVLLVLFFLLFLLFLFLLLTVP